MMQWHTSVIADEYVITREGESQSTSAGWKSVIFICASIASTYLGTPVVRP